MEELVERLNLTRDLSRNPLFEAVFVSLTMDIRPTQVEGLKFSPYRIQNRIAKFDITLQFDLNEQEIDFGFEY